MKIRKSTRSSKYKRTTKKRRSHSKKTRRIRRTRKHIKKHIKKQLKMRGGEQEGDTFYMYKNNRNNGKHMKIIKTDWDNDRHTVEDEDGNMTDYNIYDWKKYKLNYKKNSGFPQIANDVVEDEMDIESEYEDMDQM